MTVYLSLAKNPSLQETEKIKYNNRILSILENQKNDQQLRKSLKSSCRAVLCLSEDKFLKRTLNLLISKSIEVKDTFHLAKGYNIYGNEFINTGQNDSAYYYLLKSEKLFTKLNDSINLGKNYIDKAFVQLYENDFSGSNFLQFRH